MHIISVTDFRCSARKCLILPVEFSPQKSPILLEILPAEFIKVYRRRSLGLFNVTKMKYKVVTKMKVLCVCFVDLNLHKTGI